MATAKKSAPAKKASPAKKATPVKRPRPAPAEPAVRSGRPRAEVAEVSHGDYFADSSKRTGLEFVSSGCAVLDEVLGGGYVLGRMSNIIGDKSTGKTLLAIEAITNFLSKYDGPVRYVEAEAAFDQGYAEALGLPLHAVEFPELVDDKGGSDRTVEWVFEDMIQFMGRLEGRPGVYVVDSLDALSDRAELGRDISEGSYGAQKAKKLGELFRRLIGELEKSRVLLLIISQIRDKIGVTMGETKMRTGGHAMDFYATHCLWLAQIATLKKTVAKYEQAVGLQIRGNCKKNKVGLPLRKCDFPLMFGYGIDDLTANVEWLVDAGREPALAELELSVGGYKLSIGRLRDRGGQELQEFRKRVAKVTQREWALVQRQFLPKSSKYGSA